MNIIPHILIKDIRRVRMEITIALCLNAVLVWQDARPVGEPLDIWPFLFLLLPLAWMTVIARLIHGERLVGEDVWWLTRPYSRPHLLASKLALTLAVVHAAPFFGDCVVLGVKGFEPWLYLQPLLVRQLQWFASLTLPAFALACVTRGMAQFFPGAIAMLVLAGTLDSMAGHGIAPRLASTRAMFVVAPLFLASVAAAFWQFTSRRTGSSRALLGAGAVAAIAIFVFLPGSWALDLIYHELEVGPRLSSTNQPNATGGDAPHRERGAWLLPVALRIQRPELDWNREGLWAAVNAGGLQLDPADAFWNPPDWGGGNLVLSMRPEDQAQLVSRRVDVEAKIALREWQNVEAGRIGAADTVVRVPGVGACLASKVAFAFGVHWDVHCESPIPLPQPLRMTQALSHGRLATASLIRVSSHPGVNQVLPLSPIHRVQGRFSTLNQLRSPSDSAQSPPILIFRQEKSRRGIRTVQWKDLEWERFSSPR